MDISQSKRALAATYSALAPEYERVVVPVFRPMAKRLMQLIDLRPGWHVLDAGTGTGLVALLGAPCVGKGGRITGIDASEEMLEVAREKAARFGFTQCEFRAGDLEALQFQDAQFDAVLSQFALHHTDPSKSFRELQRVLKPGGTIVIQEWTESSNLPNGVLFEALAKYRVAEPDSALAAIRAQSERAHSFRSNLFKLGRVEGALRDAGFSQVEAREDKYPIRVPKVEAFLEIASAAPLIHAELSALLPEARAQLFPEARGMLKSFETPHGFEWTYPVLAVVAHKA